MAEPLTTTRTMIQLRRTVQRRTPNSLREIGIFAGITIAIGTLALGTGWPGEASDAPLLLSIAFLVWAVGWVLGPIQTGGNDLLRPEWFAMLPIDRKRLARDMLVAGSIGWGPLFTLIAGLALVVFGAQSSIAAALVGFPAALALTAFLIVLSRLASELLGAASRSRIAIELGGLQYGLVLAGSIVGWVAVIGVIERSNETDQPIAELVPDTIQTLVLALPSGWAVAAVDAAADGQWRLTVLALAGLVALTFLGYLAWTRALDRRLAGEYRGQDSGRSSNGRTSSIRPSSPIRAVAAREWHAWLRDPRRAVEVRSSLWAALFSTIAIWLLLPEVLPYAGVFVAMLGGISTANVYAMDGTSLWTTLLTPHGERNDVRGRQLAWLALFGTAALVFTIVGLVASGGWWALPSLIALLGAALGGAAGLIPLLSVYLLVPETDAHRCSGNPAETGVGAEATGIYLLMTIAVSAVVAVPSLFLWWAVASDRPNLSWLAAIVGLLTGVLAVWGLGALAIRRLERQGPELLQLMRTGPPVTHDAATAADEHDWYARLTVVQKTLFIVASILGPIFFVPLGVVPTVTLLVGGDYWLYELIPGLYQFRWLFQTVMLALGGSLLATLYILWRRASRAAQPIPES